MLELLGGTIRISALAPLASISQRSSTKELSGRGNSYSPVVVVESSTARLNFYLLFYLS